MKKALVFIMLVLLMFMSVAVFAEPPTAETIQQPTNFENLFCTEIAFTGTPATDQTGVAELAILQQPSVESVNISGDNYPEREFVVYTLITGSCVEVFPREVSGLSSCSISEVPATNKSIGLAAPYNIIL